jgi:hypothetical protein
LIVSRRGGDRKFKRKQALWNLIGGVDFAGKNVLRLRTDMYFKSMALS